MRYKPPTIEEIGLKAYMDQNGIDYELFKKLHESKVNPTNIGKALNKDRRTINGYILQYEKELANEL